MKSLKNIVVLLALIIGGTVGTTAVILGGGVAYDRIMVPRYAVAEVALYQYVEGEDASIMIGGEVDNMINRGYNIVKHDIPSHAVPEGRIMPRMLFFDANGDEIIESRMAGFWCIGDMKARFGD